MQVADRFFGNLGRHRSLELRLQAIVLPLLGLELALGPVGLLFEGGGLTLNAAVSINASVRLSTRTDRRITIASADLTADPALVAAEVRGVRVFRGYAGWGPGQLEGEIEAGAWLVLDSEPGDVFSDEPDELWRTVLRRQPGRLAWLADAPDDLSAN